MAESYHSSISSLCELEMLRAQLEETDSKLQTAAMYGKDLLDQNRELSQNLDDANGNYTKQIEALKEENYSLSQKLQQKQRMETEYHDEIDSLKKHVASQKDELKVLRGFADSSRQLSNLRNQLRDTEALSDKFECDNRQLQSVITSYEEQMKEAEERHNSMQECINDAASDELSALIAEHNKLSQVRDNLVRACRSHESDIVSLTQQVEHHVHQISSLQEELTATNCQLSDLSNSYLAATQENQDLRSEIDVLRMNDKDHKAKGNSMFTELDDRRQEAEKKLLVLNVKYEGLLNQYDLNKKQMAKLKIQMSNILRMASGQVSSDYVTDLENQLVEAHNEITSLTIKLSPASNSQGADWGEGSMFLGSDSTTLQFVEGLLNSKNNELKEITKELVEKRLTATYSNQQLNEVQHRLRSMEAKVNALHSQNIELSVKLDELKAVESPAARLVHRRVEDIPDYDSEIAQALLSTGSAPSLTSECVEESCIDAHSQSAAYELQSTISDTQSLSEVQNMERKPAVSTGLSSSPTKNRQKAGLYYTRASISPSSSDGSLPGSKANAKSYDNGDEGQRKVIDVQVDEKNPNNCQTQ